ncbi:unnamed protein product [Musa hybrid cultivar]
MNFRTFIFSCIFPSNLCKASSWFTVTNGVYTSSTLVHSSSPAFPLVQNLLLDPFQVASLIEFIKSCNCNSNRKASSQVQVACQYVIVGEIRLFIVSKLQDQNTFAKKYAARQA